MALIRLDKNTLHLDVLVGIEESYKPNKEVKKLVKEVNDFKELTFKFLEEKFGSRDVEAINKELDTDEEKKEAWKAYLTNDYVPNYQRISTQVIEINRKICPNYDEIFKS